MNCGALQGYAFRIHNAVKQKDFGFGMIHRGLWGFAARHGVSVCVFHRVYGGCIIGELKN